MAGGMSLAVPNWHLVSLFTFVSFPATFYGLWLVYRSYRREKNAIKRRGLLDLLCGMVAAFIYITAIFFVVPRVFDLPQATAYGSLGIIIVGGFAYHAVRRYNFLTINIHQVEEILENVFSDTGDAILLLDGKGTIVRFNDAAADLFGLDRGKEWSAVDILPSYSDKESYYATEMAITTGAVQRTILVTRSRLRASDETIEALLIIRDVTQQKLAEEEHIRNQQLEALGELAGGIAHDFNNYLCGITSAFGLAQLNACSSEMREIFAEVEKATLDARGLTQQLLTFARGGEPVIETVDVLALLREVMAFTTRGSACTCAFDYSGSEKAYIDADPGQIRQVFQNLALNAIQAMPDGGSIHVGAGATDADSEPLPVTGKGRYLCISVADKGAGIPEHLHTKVFEPYFTTKKEGSGLGLSVVHSIVKKHGGHVSLTSQADKGTTFRICLPVAQAGPTDRSANKDSPADFTGRALIMDDQPVVRKSLRILLHRAGLSVDEAGCGREAWELFCKATAAGKGYTVVITDLTVPGGVGGRELCEKIRKVDTQVPVILSTGYAKEGEVGNYRTLGFSGMLQKPYSYNELAEVLASATNPDRHGRAG
jgi:signal transduction histidine kinase/ActR/RegA family two-component response regulator